MDRAVVTGASSFIGKAVTKKLLERECVVYALVRDPRKLKDIKGYSNLKIIECDMSDYSSLTEKIGEKCDVFYHFAWAGTSKAHRMDGAVQESNIKNSLLALFAARELGCGSFIGAGSQAEYGICEGEVTEEHPENPVTEYGRAKLAVKRMALEYGKTIGMRVIWTRIFSAYGIGDSKETMIMTCLRKMLNNEAVDLTACTQMWDYINVEDAASAFISMSMAHPGVYNIASGDYRPLKEFVFDMKDAAGSSSELNFGNAAVSLTGHGFMPNVDRLRALGWKPETDFKTGISQIIAYLRENEL